MPEQATVEAGPIRDVPIPQGTVTFLFTDIEGSTQLVHQLGDGYLDVLNEHHALLRGIFASHSGYEVNTEGDSFFVAFSRAVDGVLAATEAQRALSEHIWPAGINVRVRMGLHTGEPMCLGSDYTGLDVHRAARIGAAAHGGQIVASEAVKMLIGARLPAELSFRDLGEHKLRDLQAPEHLYQLLAPGLRDEFPPIRTLNNRPNNLPAHLPPLIGRSKEVIAVCDLLRLPDSRLVTLLGPGGTGKTSLALNVAAQMLEFASDGVFVVELSPIFDAELVPGEIAKVLGLRENSPKSLLHQLKEQLAAKKVLLLLDNLEQVLGAANVIAPLLDSCAALRILTTSRSPLHIRGETRFSVPPLEVPALRADTTLQEVAGASAVQLFAERAAQANRNFQLTGENCRVVAEMCQKLGGLPLAIELAAARLKLLSASALHARLSQNEGRLSIDLLAGGPQDSAQRHQTIRSTIAWSYKLIQDETVKKLFSRMGVFAGGCTVSAAEAVCAEETSTGGDILDAIATLVDMSLLRQETGADGEPRLGMFETIREFALEQLHATGLAQSTQKAHAEYFARWLEEANSDAARAVARATLQDEAENIRAALAWSFRHSPDTAAQIARAIGELWFARGYWSDLRNLSERVSQLDGVEPLDRARCLRYAAMCADAQGETEVAQSFYDQALALATEADEAREVVQTTLHLVALHNRLSSGRQKADELLKRATTLGTKTRDSRLSASTLALQAEMALHDGELDEAKQLIDDQLALARTSAGKRALARATTQLARLAIWRAEFTQARTHAETAKRLYAELCDDYEAAWAQLLLAEAAYYCAQFSHARDACADARRAFKALNSTVGEAWVLYEMGRLLVATEDYLEGSAQFEQSITLLRSLKHGAGRPTLQLGRTAIYEGRLRSARKMIEKSIREFQQNGAKAMSARALIELARLDRLEGAVEVATEHLNQSLDLTRRTGAAVVLPRALQQIAYLSLAKGESLRAAQQLAASIAQREQLRMPLPPCDVQEHEKALATLRELLGPDGFAEAWHYGYANPSLENELPTA